MPDNQDSLPPQHEEKSRGKFALIGRFLAVGLFVALGTFAVIQSLSGKPKPSSEENSLVGNAVAETSETLGEKAVSGLADVKANANSLANKTSNTFKTGFQSAKRKLAPPPVIAPKKKTVIASKPPTRQGSPVSPPPVVAPRVVPPVIAKASTTVPRKTPPPDRFAQLGNGAPVRQFATAARPSPPTQNPFSATTNQLKNSTNNLLNSAASKTADTANQLKNSANNLLEGSRNPFSAKAPATNGFSGNPIQKKPAPPSSPFPSGRLQPVEANPKIDSLSTRRPFAPAPPVKKPPGSNDGSSSRASAGFNSQPLSPISRSAAPPSGSTNVSGSGFGSRPQPKPPAVRAKAPAVRSQPAVRAQTPSFGSDTSRNSARSNTGTRTRSESRVPALTASASRSIVRSGMVSPVPGDRKYDGAQTPALVIEKLCPREIQLNETTDFEIRVKNVGRATAESVQVIDKVPSGTEFISANPKPSNHAAAGDLQWNLESLRPGEEKTIRLQLKPVEPGEIGSVAQVLFATRASMRTLVTRPDLKIRHTTEPRTLIGNNVIFDVIVENSGNGPARDVIIQEQVPDLLEYQDGSRELEYEIGTLLPGQTRRVKLGLRAAKVGKRNNIMFASAKGGLRAKHETPIEIVAPKLTVESSGPKHRYLQRQATHTFAVDNLGTAKATNVEMIARLPSGLRFVSADNRGRYNSNSHTVTWVMPVLNPGVDADVKLVTVPIEAGDQDIKFEALADLKQKADTRQKLHVEHLVDVFFSIDDLVDPIEIGADTRYRIRAVNQGTQAASNVQLQLDFPAGLLPRSVDSNLRNEIRGQQVLFESISAMRPGEEITFTVTATGKTDGDHRVAINMKADGRQTPVTKEETTRVYSDR